MPRSGSYLKSATPAMRFGRVDGALYIAMAFIGFGLGIFPPIDVLDHGAVALIVVNPWHSSLHLFLGLGWMACSRTPASAKKTSLIVGLGTGFLAILGYAGLLGGLGVGGLAAPDNFIHLCTSILGLYYGTAGADSIKLERLQSDLTNQVNPWELELPPRPISSESQSGLANIPWEMDFASDE